VSQGESAVTEPQVSAADQPQAGPAHQEAAARDDADADEILDAEGFRSDEEPGGAAPGLTDVADLELEGEIAAD
jgi:hypothetical protein